MMVLIRVLSTSAHFLTNEVRLGSRTHVLVLEYESLTSSDTGVKEDRVFLIGLVLMTGVGDDIWKPDPIFEKFFTEETSKTICQINKICMV